MLKLDGHPSLDNADLFRRRRRQLGIDILIVDVDGRGTAISLDVSPAGS
ncbi:hypothetical protein [Rhizobium ruizarguesonis]